MFVCDHVPERAWVCVPAGGRSRVSEIVNMCLLECYDSVQDGLWDRCSRVSDWIWAWASVCACNVCVRQCARVWVLEYVWVQMCVTVKVSECKCVSVSGCSSGWGLPGQHYAGPAWCCHNWQGAVDGCGPPAALVAFAYLLPNRSKEETDPRIYASQESSQGLPEVLVTLKTDLSSHRWTRIALQPC
jgi:hypothetical protein